MHRLAHASSSCRRDGWGIHARLGTKLEQILRGDDGHFRDACRGSADERPHRLVAHRTTKLQLHHARFACRIPPALRGVVIVGAGVGDGVVREVLRQVGVRSLVTEAELQDLHAGQRKTDAQGVNFRSDEAEIFSDQRQRPQCGLKGMKELEAGALIHSPLTAVSSSAGMANRLQSRGNVEAHDVVELAGATDALDPPCEAGLLRDVPAVEGIAQRWPVGEK